MFRMENQSELAGNNVASLWRMKHTPYLLDIQSHQDLTLQCPGPTAWREHALDEPVSSPHIEPLKPQPAMGWSWEVDSGGVV